MKLRKSLKYRLFLVYIIFMLLFSSAISSFVYIQNRNYTQSALKDSYQNTASFLVSNIESEINTLGTYSYILARNPSLLRILLNPYDIYDIVVALNAEIEPTIQLILNNNNHINNITIYTDETQREIPSPYFADISTVKETAWYQTIGDLDGYHIYSSSNELYIITPIRNYHSQKIDNGFVKLDIDITKLATNVLSKHKDLQISLSSEEGDVLFSTIDLPASDNYLTLSQHDLRSTPATVTFYLHRSLMQLPIGNMLLPVMLILAASIMVTYLFMRYMNNSIFSRLEMIKDKVSHMDTDHFIITIDDQPDDEIGALCACINKMSVKIDTMFTELDTAKGREQRAEIEALRARIDPHFLYNVLNTINWIALDGNVDLVHSLTQELAVYYRTTLNDGEPISSIKNELENVRAYLNLQKIATSDAFDVSYHLDDRLLDYEVCDFILQPLVENAITHGIKPLKDRRGAICVELYEQNGDIYFSITDNGIGLEHAAAVKDSMLKKHHYGIKNINLRIALTFGSEYGVGLTPGPSGIGTTALIHLPKRPHK